VGSLSGVSCANSSHCWAVGSDETSSGGNAIVSHWNGSAWTTKDLPNTPGVALSAISCVTNKSCTAVGNVGYGSGGLVAERWNGQSWTQQTLPTPAGTTYAQLLGVSCGSTSCEAVGETGQFGETALVVGLSTVGWAIQSAPAPSDATNSWLNGVACVAAQSCTTVGFYTDKAGTTLPLIDHLLAGAWKVQGASHPAGATITDLFGVSCIGASTCTAVGQYHSGSPNVENPLAEGEGFTS